MTKKFIEIKGIGFPNKGAELMLYSIVYNLRHQYPDCNIMCNPSYGMYASFPILGELDVHQRFIIGTKNYKFSFPAELMPIRLLRTYGLARASEVDIVFDASGYFYTDKWNSSRTMQRGKEYKRLKKRGKKVILMPQAFGPFRSPKHRYAIEMVIDNSDLVFVRDDQSIKYLNEVVGVREYIKKAPDFTVLCKGQQPENIDKYANRIGIIPNSRMIDKTSESVAKTYTKFLENCILQLSKMGHDICLINHEGKPDINICIQLSESIENVHIPIINEKHPVHLKGIIGSLGGLITSRFHGAVSGLVQNVPTLATSWSHKYEQLFSEWGLNNHVISPDIDENLLAEMLKIFNKGEERDKLLIKMNKHCETVKKSTSDMWDLVYSLIER